MRTLTVGLLIIASALAINVRYPSLLPFISLALDNFGVAGISLAGMNIICIPR